MMGKSQLGVEKVRLGASLCEAGQTRQPLCACVYHSEGDIMKDTEEVMMEKKQDIQTELSNCPPSSPQALCER